MASSIEGELTMSTKKKKEDKEEQRVGMITQCILVWQGT